MNLARNQTPEHDSFPPALFRKCPEAASVIGRIVVLPGWADNAGHAKSISICLAKGNRVQRQLPSSAVAYSRANAQPSPNFAPPTF
jgi:hypothetical protein